MSDRRAPTHGLDVLVVEDSVVTRRLVASVLEEDPRIRSVTTAADGRLALGRIELHRPDVVTLDLDMPVMDGLTLLDELARRDCDVPVVVYSTQGGPDVAVTLDALARGAADYVLKPRLVEDREAARASVRRDLVPRVVALGRGARSRPPARTHEPLPWGRRTSDRVDVVVVAASTGGPQALTALLSALPADLPVPVLVVQHMHEQFTRQFAERLDDLCALTVREAGPGDEVVAGQVLLAPGDRHLTVHRVGGAVRVRLDRGEKVCSVRPAADLLFTSAVRVYGENVLGVVLTGLGSDGSDGSEEIVAAGGSVLVQDEQGSVAWGMPGSVVARGAAAQVLTLEAMAQAVLGRVATGRSWNRPLR